MIEEFRGCSKHNPPIWKCRDCLIAGGVNVAFCSTAYGPLWAPAMESWLRLVGYTSRHFAIEMVGKLGGAGITDRMYTHTAQNGLVQDMLEQDFTHIFLTEMDMILPFDAITKLMALDKDMAAGWYCLRSEYEETRGQPCLYKKAAVLSVEESKDPNSRYYHTPVTLFPQNEPFRMDCAGLGCVLIKRKVFETLPYPWFDLKAGDKKRHIVGYGSDIYFYTHAREAGFELWVDPTVECGQIDYYITTPEDYRKLVKRHPEFAGAGFVIGGGHAAQT